MYDDPYLPFARERYATGGVDPGDDRWFYERTYGAAPGDERVRHLVLVDGRMVDTWVESLTGSRWEHEARDYERRHSCRHLASIGPPQPPYVQVLDWLDEIVGGRRALEALDTAPLTAPPSTVGEPDGPDAAAHEAVADLLTRVVDRFFDDEVAAALRRALDRLWDIDRALVTSGKPAAVVAGGICWLVGRANGLFADGGRVRQRDVQRELWLKSSIAGPGKTVQTALRGLDPAGARRPMPCPDLVPTGDPALLVSATRRELVALRDRALDARERHAADEAVRAATRVLPSEVES